jgi:hypothetical protein
VPGDTILMLYLYRKSGREDLTVEDVRALAKVVSKEYP